jgi:hypothetical protein
MTCQACEHSLWWQHVLILAIHLDTLAYVGSKFLGLLIRQLSGSIIPVG